MGSNFPLPQQSFPQINAAGSMPVSSQPNGIPSGGFQTPGGLVLNFFGSNFTGQNVPPPPPPQNTPPATQASVVPFWPSAQQPIYPATVNTPATPSPITTAEAPAVPSSTINPGVLSGQTGGASTTTPSTVANSTPPDVSKMTPAEQLNALYQKYNEAQKQQDAAKQAVKNAEDARNAYLTMGNVVKNGPLGQQSTATVIPKPSAEAANSSQTTPSVITGNNDVPVTPETTPQPALAGKPGEMTNIGSAPTSDQPSTVSNLGNLSPAAQAIGAQALQQSGLDQPTASFTNSSESIPAQPNQMAEPQPSSATQNTPDANQTSAQQQQSTPPQAAQITGPSSDTPVTSDSDPSANTTPEISGAKPEVLDNLIFKPDELVQFKKLNPKEQIDWITQQNLQTKADAIGEIAIQSGLPNGNQFPPETYDRLEAIEKLDTKDIKGQPGADLGYFRKTALWTEGLLDGSQNASTPVKNLPGIKTMEYIARNPKEPKDIRIAAAQALQAVNRGNTKEMQDILKRINTNEISVLKPWSWLRARTPQDVKGIVDAARKGIPIQANQQAVSTATTTPSTSLPAAATNMNSKSSQSSDDSGELMPMLA